MVGFGGFFSGFVHAWVVFWYNWFAQRNTDSSPLLPPFFPPMCQGRGYMWLCGGGSLFGHLAGALRACSGAGEAGGCGRLEAGRK